MLGKQSATRPTALGVLLSSGAYGNTIPNAYGTPRLAPQVIWGANVRKHGGGFFDTLAGHQPTYVMNTDMILATNPILDVLQIWSQQQNSYPLNFIRLIVDIAAGGSWHNTIDMSVLDANFYAMCAISAIVFLKNDPFSLGTDYGAPGPTVYFGSGGVGNNAYEFPLWNSAHHGPDLGDPHATRFPSYNWSPVSGPIVDMQREYIEDLIGNTSMPNPTRNEPFATSFLMAFYYAQLSSVLKHKSPLVYNRFTFENQLGNGTEYADAGASPQQIIYPMYAGVGSDDMDLGTSAAIPSWRFEVQGTGGFIPSSIPSVTNGGVSVNPRADAEFADIVEDVIRSGMKQYGAALGYIQNGCNCNDLPGPVQKHWYQELDPSLPNAYFNQPNTAGSILLATASSQSFAAPTITDTAGNAWISLFSHGGQVFSYVLGCNASTGRNNVASNVGGFGSEAYIMEFDPGSQAIDAINVVPAAGGIVTASITTTSDISYVVAIISGPGAGPPFPPPIDIQWQKVFPAAPGGQIAMWARKFTKAGTVVTFSANLATGAGSGYVALFAVKSAQVAGTVPYPKALGNIIDYDSLWNVRLACRCGGLQGSLAMDSQRNASDWLKDLAMAGNFEYVWGGFSLKSIARSEVSQIGDGTGANVSVAGIVGLASVYWAPTATGPVATLTDKDLIASPGQPSVTIERTSLTDANRIVQIQHFDRNNKYNQALTSQPETASISLYGPRKDPPIVLNMIMNPAVARIVAAIEGRRNVLLLNNYKFKVKANLLFLEAMDLILLSVANLGLNRPLRLRKVVENAQFELECEAEDYIYGLHAPQVLAATTITSNTTNFSAIPADVNAPIIFEPPLRMCLSGQAELWFVVSDSDPNYGGCAVYISTDGGTTYTVVLGVIQGNATTGFVTVDFPISIDPDTTNTLSVDLTESLGVLAANTAEAEAAFTFPLYLASTPLYELAAMLTPTLTAPYKYNIGGSVPNPIRRSVFGVPTAGTGVDHPINSRFAWLDNRENNTPPGILKVILDLAWIGVTLKFKFVQFNKFQQGVGDLSAVTAYSFTPTGVGTGTSGGGSGGGSGGSTSQPPYTLTGGALTNPTSTTIHMAAATAIFPGSTVYYDARTFTISAPAIPTTYYVTIADPNQVGDTGPTPTLTATCQTSSALVGVPGNVYIGSIVAQPAGGGTETGGGGFPPPAGVSFDGV